LIVPLDFRLNAIALLWRYILQYAQMAIQLARKTRCPLQVSALAIELHAGPPDLVHPRILLRLIRNSVPAQFSVIHRLVVSTCSSIPNTSTEDVLKSISVHHADGFRAKDPILKPFARGFLPCRELYCGPVCRDRQAKASLGAANITANSPE
jgi:hypothetical protein